jgi:hypothetical protein
MNPDTDIDELVNSFRLASRELFNNFFRTSNPYIGNEGWTAKERFSAVQSVLFQKLVTEPAGLSRITYGDPQPNIGVEIRIGENAPVMLNRETRSGYWDHPVTQVTREAGLRFLAFFDWDQLGCKDNQYARILVDRWPSRPEVVGKEGLIDCRHVRFVKV